ncbi:MAG TPA: Uma2 family endonuclease [Pirellulales bacterium]|nr:Uma2 family endonuclease [Pirellulales bacterium]
MHQARQTRRQELIVEGSLHLPLSLFDFEKFRRWRHSHRCPDRIRASYLGGMVYIETGFDWSMHYWNGHGPDDEPPPELEKEPCFCIDGWFYVPSTAFELEGFRDWIHSDWFPEKVKATFIDGSIEVHGGREEIESHGKPKVELIAVLGRFIKRHALGDLFAGATVVWPPADLSTNPDLVYCSYDGYRSGRVRQNERVQESERFVELVGAPDLMVEVVSTSSTGKDKHRLRRKYFVAGIPEYWIVDARSKKEIRFQLLVRGEKDYEAVEPDEDGYRFSPVFQRRFRIARRTNPVGHYDYRLLTRKSEAK